MKTKKLDALLIWKQIEDQLVLRLRLNLAERAVYYHLVRHSRLEGAQFTFPTSPFTRTLETMTHTHWVYNCEQSSVPWRLILH